MPLLLLPSVLFSISRPSLRTPTSGYELAVDIAASLVVWLASMYVASFVCDQILIAIFRKQVLAEMRELCQQDQVCFMCGYSMAEVFGTRCPECGTDQFDG